MQKLKSDICKNDKQNEPLDTSSADAEKKKMSDEEIEKINNIRCALNEISRKEEEEEILERITENVRLVKDYKENPEKYIRNEQVKTAGNRKKRHVQNTSYYKKRIRKKQQQLSGGIIPRKGDSAGELVRKSVFWLSACVFAGCILWLGTELYSRYTDQQKYEDISQKYSSSHEHDSDSEDSAAYNTAPPESPTEEATLTMLPGAANLLELSPNVVGYISIPDTVISYPLMQNKDDTEGEEYFLGHDFYGNSSNLGSIYLDFRCIFDAVGDDGRRTEPNSDNLIVYGHNMRDGSMFGSLKDYQEQSGFYEKHPIIEINSNYKKYTYKIYGYFIADAVDTTDTRFEYWNYINFQNEDDFYEYVNEIKRRSLITTDVDVKYGDSLLTLSTCNYTISNGRLVVCARRLREGEELYEGVAGSKPNTNIKWPTIHRDSSAYDPNAEFVPYG